MIPESISIILNALYEQYYKRDSFSDATSSHWRHYGNYQSMLKTEDGYQLHGIGFGSHAVKTWYNAILTWPTRIYLRNMLSTANSNSVLAAEEISALTGRTMSYDMARMVLSSDLLTEHVENIDEKTVVIIGDGYGSLGSLLKQLYPLCRIVYINLGRTLAFDAFYTGLAAPNSEHKLLTPDDPTLSQDFSYIPAEEVFSMPINAEIFVNIASMQEMNPSTIDTYFRLIRSQPNEVIFYCCNRLEKVLPDGTITRFRDYDWRPEDKILVDGLCPWHQKAPQNRPPFTRQFDGPIYHRLVKIFPKKSN